MYGKDIERILISLNTLKDLITNQIETLSYDSDYRIALIDHTHTVHVGDLNGSPEGTPNGPHGHPDGTHVNILDVQLTGRNDPPATNYRQWAIHKEHNGPDHFEYVSDQLTYPTDEARGYTRDLHKDHQHIEPERLYEREHPEPATKYITPIANFFGSDVILDIIKMKQIDKNNYVGVNSFNATYGSPWKEMYRLQDQIETVKEYGNKYPELQWIGEKHTLKSLMQLALTYTIDAKWAISMYHDWIQRGYDTMYNDNEPSITWDRFDGPTKESIGIKDQDYKENINLEKPTLDPY